jgi:hypothetical protein
MTMLRPMLALVVLAACVAPAGLRGHEPAKKAADEPLLKVEGELTRDDPVDPVLKKGFYKVYPIKLAAGAYYQIDLVSKDFDAYLRLEDARGNPLAEDDDSGGDLNSRIVFTPKSDGVYHLIATSLDGQLGDYTLSVREEK